MLPKYMYTCIEAHFSGGVIPGGGLPANPPPHVV